MKEKTKIFILWIITILLSLGIIYCIIALFIQNIIFGIIAIIVITPYLIGILFMFESLRFK